MESSTAMVAHAHGELAEATHEELEQLVSGLRGEYLEGLAERLGDVEERLLRLEQHRQRPDDAGEIARTIHSIKGSAGTYGLPLLTGICHQFEDELRVLVDSGARTGRSLEPCLKLVELMRRVAVLYGGPGLSDEAHELHTREIRLQLDRLTQRDAVRILVADNSRAAFQVIARTAAELHGMASYAADGYVALGRLLSEPFNVLVYSRHLRTLGGDALLAMLRATPGTRSLRTILIASDDRPHLQMLPDFMILRKQLTGEQLRKTIVEALLSAGGPAVSFDLEGGGKRAAGS